ncbi:MAG: helix-turn-helix domain-containing protein [Agriterribacter sp.]
MKLYFEDKATGAVLQVLVKELRLENTIVPGEATKELLTIVWNKGLEQTVNIDEVAIKMPSQSIISLVSNQQFYFENAEDLIVWQFNSDFYSIIQQDAEAGCAGFLFYSGEVLLIEVAGEKQLGFDLLFKMFIEEFSLSDNIQPEMLRALLKRLLIKITTEAKKRRMQRMDLTEERFTIIRQYNMQVEQHFREEHEVQFYAAQLHRSPKTLANIFLLFNHDSPLKVIHKRIVMEAKRFFYYTNKSSKEVGDILGFPDAANFSRFFKTQTGVSPSVFKSRLPASKSRL